MAKVSHTLEARDAHNERMCHQWRWVRYKADNGIKGNTPMYRPIGIPTEEYMVFCALERMGQL